MNEQTPNPNATNEGKNEQAAVSSLPVSPESKPEVVTEVQPEVQKEGSLGLVADQISAGRT